MVNKIIISSKKQTLIVYIILTAITLAVFWQMYKYDFISLDDYAYVVDNSHIPSGITLNGLRWAFSTTYAEFWHPLTWLSLMFDYQLFGLNAGGYHLTSLILHILSALLLFWLFNRMTGAIGKSAFIAAFFALHPLHVESVAWIAERKDVLSAFFWMLTLCFYVYYTEKPITRRYLLVVFSFVLALLSKPMVVTLPVVMILLDYWPLQRFELKNTESNLMEVTQGKRFLWLLWEKTPFFILSAVFSIITLYAQYKPSATYFTLSSRLANAPVSFVTYLEKTFWPHDMVPFYPFSDQLPVWHVLGATLLILVISTVVIVMAKRLPYLFAGWLWYAIILLPVIGIIQIGDFAMADRYHYLPSVGIAIGLAWGIPSLFPREDIRRIILFPASTAFLAIMAVLSWQQCGYWKNSIELFNHTLQVTKNNYLAHNNLGVVLFNEGKIEEAIDHYNKAIRLKPNYIQSYYNRGNAYARLGQYQRAFDDLNEAINLNPGYFKAYNGRAINYAKLGQFKNAIDDFNMAIKLKEDFADAYKNRAVFYLNQNNKELGCPDALKSCTLGNCGILEIAKAMGDCP
jgi:hypothetical protein